MRLYLVQHGDALSEEIDPERPLSEQGWRDVEAVGAFLASRRLQIGEVWHSGKLRARQTAEGLAPYVAATAVVRKCDGLAPKDDTAALAETLNRREHNLMIVGHLPHLERLADRLLTGKTEAHIVAFAKAGVVCLTQEGKGSWAIAWMVTPDLLAANSQ